MKKKILTFLLVLLIASSVFAQESMQKLFLGTHSFVTEDSDSWKIYDSYFISVNPIDEEFTFIGSFNVKLLLGYSRYNFECTVKNLENDFSVEITKMESYACDKNNNILKNGSVSQTSKKVAEQYAAQIKDEIKNRIMNISDDSVDTLFTKVITTPEIITTIGNSMSDLAIKKFIEKNVNGNEVEIEVTLNSIDEPDELLRDFYKCEYQARGYVNTYKSGFGRFIEKDVYSITIYSNNDKLVSAKIGSTYKAKGKITVKLISSGTFSFLSYEIHEE